MVQNPIIEPDIGVSLPFTSRGILEVAWSRKSLVALGVVIFLVLGILYYTSATRIYQSKAQVLVTESGRIFTTRNVIIEDYVATHKAIIESPLIINRAIAKGNLDSFESFVGKEDIVDAVSKQLTVTRNRSAGSTSSNILDLSFRCAKIAEAPRVLKAVIETFKEYLDEIYRSSSEDTLEKITKEREALKKELKQKQDEYTNFLKSAPFIARNKEGASLSQEALSSLGQSRSTILLKKVDLQGYLETIDKSLKNGGNREALLSMMADWNARLETEGNKSASAASNRNQLLTLKQREQELLQSRGGIEHPDVKAVRNQIEATQKFFTSPSSAWQQAGPDLDPIESYRTYLKDLVNHVEVAEKRLDAVYQEEQDKAKEFNYYHREDEKFKTEIAHLQKMSDEIIKRLRDVNLVKNVGGYDAKTIADPSIAKKVSPNGVLVFPAFAVFGILLGVGLAFLAEMRDKSFHNIDEIRTQLGLAVAGHIPTLKPVEKELCLPLPNGAVADPMVWALYRPQSVEAESFRGIRTALYFSSGGGQKVIQVTSANGGDGKSTVTANLAVSIAQSGKSILLIDADLRKPRVHKLFGLSDKAGLVSVLTGQMELQDAIQAGGVRGLSILTCGPLPPNPAEMLTAPNFSLFLDSVREKYDFVLLDTPPLLVVTDPSVVASRADGVFLTIQLTKESRIHATRAKEILTTLGVRILGVIVNKADRQSGYSMGYSYHEGYHEAVKEADNEVKPRYGS